MKATHQQAQLITDEGTIRSVFGQLAVLIERPSLPQAEDAFERILQLARKGAEPKPIVVQIHHLTALQVVLKLDQDSILRRGIPREQTFVPLLEQMLAGTPISPEDAVKLAGWLRTLSGLIVETTPVVPRTLEEVGTIRKTLQAAATHLEELATS
jgi:hypothetical protein